MRAFSSPGIPKPLALSSKRSAAYRRATKSPPSSDTLGLLMRGHVVVIGVGDSGRGDDAVGPLVVEMLAARGVEPVIDAGRSPEIETWRVRELSPDTVLFVDAVDLGAEPGDAAILEPADLRSTGFDTHRAPLKLTMDYLERELGCTCRLLAVQPRDVRQDAPMCAEVRQSAERLASILEGLLQERHLCR